MFGLDPLSRPVAIAEILLLLAFAALIGWLLGRLILTGRMNALRSSIKDKEAELAECRRAKAVGAPALNRPVAPMARQSTFRAEAAPPIPATYITADPLLPAFDQTDTVRPVTAPAEVDSMPPVADRPTLPGTPTADDPVESVTIVPMSARASATNMPVAGTPIVGLPATGMPATGMPATGNSEAAVLNRIAARASELNFDRIGRALPTEADDLKDIVGVGPFLERKLHSLGIYTFRQVANFTKEDIDKVNEIIEFFPGRIERDNWVEQSKGFHERKYGAKNK